MNQQVSPAVLLDAIRKEKERRAASASLYEFIRQAWSTVEPGVKFIPSWHIETICEHLEAVTAGEIKRLLINIPPRHSKSTIVSVMWPMWEWLVRPEEKYLCASYSGSLSIRDNLKARRLIQSPWYQERWGHLFQLAGDQNAKQRFENNRTGYRLATSVGGSATGEGGSRLICLHPDTLIQCEDGQRKIGEIVKSKKAVKVLGYDHASGPIWQSIEQFESSPGRPCLKIKWQSGAEIVLTEDHPVWIEDKGYIQAKEVKIHDRTLRYLPIARESKTITDSQLQTNILQQEMCGRSDSQTSNNSKVPSLWQRVQALASSYCQKYSRVVLQSRLPCRWPDWRGQQKLGWRFAGKTLRNLRENRETEKIHGFLASRLLKGLPKKIIDQAKITGAALFDLWKSNSFPSKQNVFSPMFGIASSANGERLWEWKICARQSVRGLSGGIQENHGCHPEKRWKLLQMVRKAFRWSNSSCASHQLQQNEQLGIKSDNSLSFLSRKNAWKSEVKGKLEFDFVSSIESAPVPAEVFNLRIAGTHNYFAEGQLLHNCDDPHSAQDAQSDAMRESTLEWFDMVWSTRLNDPKRDAMIVVMQRLHERDVSGHILSDIKGWEHICIPAEFDGRRRKTVLGPYDPRKEKGELICPERFGQAEIDNLKQLLGTYGSSGQLQQDPVPPEGGILKIKYFNLWPADKGLPPFEYILQSYDCAFTEKTTGDPTACTVWGMFTHNGERNAMLIDAWDEHLSYPELRERAIKDWNTEYGGMTEKSPFSRARRPDRILVEAKASGQSLLQDLRQARVPAVAYNPGMADKISRAHQIAPMLEMGLLWIPESQKNPGQPVTWANAFLKQLAKFPVAEHDDLVDCCSQAIIYLRDDGWFELPRARERDDPREYQRERVNPYAV